MRALSILSHLMVTDSAAPGVWALGFYQCIKIEQNNVAESREKIIINKQKKY